MKRSVLFLGLGCLSLLGAGCFGAQTAAAPDGGVYRTANYGTDWTQPSVLNQGVKIGSIANVGTVSAAFDPQDPQVMYVGTVQNGMLMTLDGGESWQQARGLTTGQVEAIAVNPQNKCNVFVARANQLLKTDTCGRDWTQAYYDPRTAQLYTVVVIDPLNSRAIYAGNADGDILRSEDSGASWRVLYRADARVNDLVIDPKNRNVLYVATNGAGLLKSTDAGATWIEIRSELDQYDGARRPLKVYLDPVNSNIVYNVSRNGILRSEDGGTSWRALSLPTPASATNIRAFSVHPKNSNLLVYATDTSIVFTSDLGQTWTPKQLPTTRSASFIVFDQGPQTNLYLGTIPRR